MLDDRSVNEQQPSTAQPGSDSGTTAERSGALSLDELQDQMESIALGQSPNEGRFCAFCYGRLSEPIRRRPSRLPASLCEYCGTASDQLRPVREVPAEVLGIYLAKRRREGLIVNLFAFLGIFLALAISAGIWLATPDNLWKIAPFAVLVLGSYYLARVAGYNVGVPLGSTSGRKLRNERWTAYLQGRNTVEALGEP